MKWRKRARTHEYHGLYSDISRIMWGVREPASVKLPSADLIFAKKMIRSMVATLPARERAAVSHWFSGRSQQEIADEEGVTQACISFAAKRGLKKLRKQLQECGIESTNLWPRAGRPLQ